MTMRDGRATDWNISGWILGLILAAMAFAIVSAFIRLLV